MVIFDQLRISDDGRSMFIDAHVSQATGFENVYMESITIRTADKVTETNLWNTDDVENPAYRQVFDEGLKELHLILSVNDFLITSNTLSDNLFFVFIKDNGNADPCVPCPLTESVTLGVTFDEALLYQKMLQFTKQLADTCNISDDFVDMILLWNGFKAAVETEHYIDAKDFYYKLFRNGSIRISTSGCGCHG